jgi:hypothetical protein
MIGIRAKFNTSSPSREVVTIFSPPLQGEGEGGDGIG